MIRKPRLAALVVSLVCILILAACNCAPTLRYITVSPTTASIQVGTTQQYTATGYYSNGNTTPGLAVSWSASPATVATISNAGSTAGVATAVGPGTATITATALGITSSSATLNVSQIISIAVTPANPTVAAGATEQFEATGTYKNPNGTTSTGMTGDLTSLVTWSTTPSTLATFSTTTLGLATASTTPAFGTVTATLDGVTGTTGLTVGAPGPISLIVIPATATIAVDNAIAFTAQELWSDGTKHTPSGTVSWTSATTTTATVQANSGQAKGLAAGSSVITATEGSFTATATLTVVVGSSHFAYVSNSGSGTIQWYSVSATTSPYLTSSGTLTLTSTFPTQTVIHPSGQYLYYTDTSSNVWVTTINSSTGTLTPTTFPAQAGGSGNTNFAVIDPYGRFLYVSDDGGGTGGTITGFTIQADGSLKAISLSPSPFTTNLSSPECLIIDRTGTYLYASNNGNNTISAYTIDQTSGALTAFSGTPFPTGSGPWQGGLDPSGTHLYVANSTANSITGFTIGSGGVLTSVGTDTAVTGATSIQNLVVDPSGTHIYALDSGTTTNGQVFGFNIGSGGVIGSAISGTPVDTGEFPLDGIVIDRSGALLAVGNNFSNNISLYTIGSGGALTADTPVNTGTGPLFVTFYNAP